MFSLWIFILVVQVITLVPGVVLNVAVFMVHGHSWRHLGVGGYDRIVLTMASANAVLQVLITYGGILFYSQLFPLLPAAILSQFLFMFLSFIDLCFWNTFWLSACYCLTLVQWSQRLLLKVKSRMSSAVSALLLGSSLGCLLINLPFIWTTMQIPRDNIGNSSACNYRLGMTSSYVVLKISLGSCLPFLLTFFCIVLSVRSLLRHVWKLRRNSSDIRFSQLQGHIRAVRTMILWLVLDLAFCIVVMGVLMFSLNVGVVLGTLAWILIMLYPSLQAMVLITGNPKLKKQLFGQRQKSSEPPNA